MVVYEDYINENDMNTKVFMIYILLATTMSKSLVIFLLAAFGSVALGEIAELTSAHQSAETVNVGSNVIGMMVKWLRRDERLRGKKRRQIWRQNRLSRLGMRTVCFVSMMGTAHRMETQQLPQQIGILTKAATQTANAGLESGTKILKTPDVYNGDEPIQFHAWKMQFESWFFW